ncbi:AAA family ATPase [Microcoleus sp. Pol11C3]|uniref:AAA family ATPase n=1 Tax=Microcoleus sp. Pol11C3 TaxID=3055390 RepID=UPI002FD75B02
MTTLNFTLTGYQTLDRIYSGTRTLVYRGTRQCDKQPVAIKVLRSQYPNFSELVQFRNQYTIAKNLNLPGIIETYSLEAHQNSYALIMEDFGGISLKEWREQGETLPNLRDFLQMAIDISNTLDILSRHRIIHKDIKPANILINPQTKQVKLIDFSIASLLPRETQTLINPNVLEGTLGYLSPEQTGRMNRGIDYRTDFYSLGVTFYELLAGQLPFQSNDAMELVHSHIAKQAPSLHEINPQIPSVLSEIVSKLMAKNAEDRYQSGLGLKFDLEFCLSQLQQSGKIEGFEIAQRDVCDRFSIPEKLYGRETEVETLLEAFERVSSGTTEMMLVAGLSGIGKTVVVNEVHKPIVRQRGYFIKGKFDQFNRNIPFSAFVQSFRDLMGQLLSESDEQLGKWQTQILQTLGDNAQVIIEVIPELEKIIGQQPPATELSGVAAQNLFNLLFHKFISVFTTKEHPLVMFLDDLQWVDSASLKLIELLVGESQSSHLLLIGAYRDNEVSATHPLMLTLDKVGKAGAIVNTMTLAPLDSISLNQLVADTLSCPPNLAQRLTELVEQKTKGNPFFATQFLKTLHQDKFINFDLKAGHWQCDISKVREAALTDDVVEFMAQQLQKLPIETQSVLKLAACIGNQFDLATLAIVSENSETETATALWKSLQEGLVLPQSEVYKFYVGEEENIDRTTSPTVFYRFLHDRVQQAAYSLIPESDRAIAHYQIGQLLLQQISPEAREERIFELVNQLNYGTALVVEQIERDDLAKLNLTACRKARGATAYQAAREYATVGLTLLGIESWQRQYEMTLALHELAAEVASLLGKFEQMNQWIETVIHHAKTPLEQVQVYQVKIQALVSRNQLLDAIATGKSILQLLGVSLPDNPTLEDIRLLRQEIDTLISGSEAVGDSDGSIEKLIHLPKMTDAQQLAIMQIASGITPVCFLTGSMLYFLIVALQVKLSIQYGNSLFSAFCYASYAFQLRTLWGEMTEVPQFGQLGYQLASEPDAKNIRPATALLIGGFVRHWIDHLQKTLPILQEGYQAALETGNLEFVGYDAQFFCLNSYWCGQPLTELEPQIRAYYQQLRDLNQVTTANCFLVYWQATLILLGQSENQIPLRQDSYEEKIVSEAKISNDFYRLCHFYLYRFTLSFLLQDIAKAEKDAVKTRQYLVAGMGSIIEPTLYFYDSLTVLATAPESTAESEAQWQRVQENQAKLKEWAHHAPMNHLHKYHLVEAQKYQILDHKTEALEFYDLAIEGAKENGYIQEEALANELAAKFYLEWGKEKVAAGYMQEAYYGYARWGAKAKTDDLEKRYPQLLQPILQQRRLTINPLESIGNPTFSINSSSACTSSSTSSSISNALDFASVLKAAQAISSSIELDELMASLTRILLENSGAQKSALILIENGTLQVRAITSVNNQANSEDIQTVLDAQPLETCQDVPRKIIQYVKNTQQTVIIERLKTDIPGLIGHYLLAHQPQSLCCTPIVDRGNLLGIIYLENQLTSGVFTSDRLQIIKLLSAQAAISLENALLYQQAQQDLEDLQQAHLQIVQSEKMSALGNLVAGVAHEINNPVGFINGNIDEATTTINDVINHLKLYQEKLPNPGDEIAQDAEDIDLEYALEDLPKMLSSMKVGCDRIRGISTSLRTFSRADKDYKVPFNIHEGIESTILILKHRLKANEHRLAIEVVTHYGNLPKIECFPGQLNQVLMNLLANAIDALEESNQGRSLEAIKANPYCITVRTSQSGDRHIKIQIADNGAGMTEAVKQRIFDHLFTTKAVGKGTGLGLAIARQIVVETHGGTIEVNSHQGEGTEFEIVLPITQ